MSVAETTPAAPKKKAARNSVVTIKITLRGSKPPIWRRVVISGSSTLGDLHGVIQRAMGWTGGHLHHFEVNGRHYSDPSEMVEGAANEERLTLNGLVKSGAKRFGYTYDFGDNWEHIITIEKVGYADVPPTSPVCIAGKRACPPEDCGGIWGYYDLLEALADPGHPEHEQQKEWCEEWYDGALDPETFEIGFVNERLSFIVR
jgi:hypothetical protein